MSTPHPSAVAAAPAATFSHKGRRKNSPLPLWERVVWLRPAQTNRVRGKR